jgi:hypothetical protein
LGLKVDAIVSLVVVVEQKVVGKSRWRTERRTEGE